MTDLLRATEPEFLAHPLESVWSYLLKGRVTEITE